VDCEVETQRVVDYLQGRRGSDPEGTWLHGIRRLPAGPSFAFDWNVAVASERQAAVGIGADDARGARNAPTSVEFLTELPEAVRAHEEPFSSLADYLRWRGTVSAVEPARPAWRGSWPARRPPR
jgi:hypothetical protein